MFGTVALALLCPDVPVLLLKSFKRRHVVHLSEELTENGNLTRTRDGLVEHGAIVAFHTKLKYNQRFFLGSL